MTALDRLRQIAPPPLLRQRAVAKSPISPIISSPPQRIARRQCGARAEILGLFAGDSVVSKKWYSWVELNHRPPDPQSGALTN